MTLTTSTLRPWPELESLSNITATARYGTTSPIYPEYAGDPTPGSQATGAMYYGTRMLLDWDWDLCHGVQHAHRRRRRNANL